MKTSIFGALVAAILATGAANAAVWERPAGAYTPTNHSVNTTKYQIDRANGVAISSAKVDGDINKAFQGLNSLEARVPPSVIGQTGKALLNDGANTYWGLISPTSISSGLAAAGQVMKANGTGAAVFGLLDTSSFPNLGVSGTYSLPTITVNTAGIVTSVTQNLSPTFTSLTVSGTATISGTVSASSIACPGCIAFATATAQTSDSTATWTPSGLAVTITPSLVGQKVKIDVAQTLYNQPSGGGNTGRYDVRLLRGATVLQTWSNLGTILTANGSANTYDGINGVFHTVYVDSPAVTTSVTYSVQFRSGTGTATIYGQYQGAAPSNITAELF
jgi:hypothetical protein